MRNVVEGVPAGIVTASEADGAALTPMSDVLLYTSTTDGDIYYTTDGSNPQTSNTKILYSASSPVVVTQNMQINAYVYIAGSTAGAVSQFNYTCTGTGPNGGMVPDGSFETGTISTMWNTRSSTTGMSVDNTYYEDGTHSIKVTPPTSSARWIQSSWITINQAYDYQLTCWVKT